MYEIKIKKIYRRKNKRDFSNEIKRNTMKGKKSNCDKYFTNLLKNKKK